MADVAARDGGRDRPNKEIIEYIERGFKKLNDKRKLEKPQSCFIAKRLTFLPEHCRSGKRKEVSV
jgi:hypothetical protein